MYYVCIVLVESTIGEGGKRPSDYSRVAKWSCTWVVGWSNNHFNNLHFRISLENKHNYRFKTHKACEFLKRRLLK